VLSVECSKVKKKSRTNKIVYFNLTINWSDDGRTHIQRSYVSVFDFMTKIVKLCKQNDLISDTQLELKPEKWFDKSFLISKEDKKTIEEFFQQILKLPEVITRSHDVIEYFKMEWAALPESESSKTTKTENNSDESQSILSSATNSITGMARPCFSKTHHSKSDSKDLYEEICIQDGGHYDELDLKPKTNSLVDQSAVDSFEKAYYATEAYFKRHSGEISFEIGSLINVIQCELSGWWFVQDEESKEQGWAPASCLLPVDRLGLDFQAAVIQRISFPITEPPGHMKLSTRTNCPSGREIRSKYSKQKLTAGGRRELMIKPECCHQPTWRHQT